MTEDVFKIGDVVRLKSGGPKMTIEGKAGGITSGPNDYLCRWFDEKNTPKQGSFHQDMIER